MFTGQMNVISFQQRENSKCDTHEIPQGAECGNTRLLAALHNLRITVVVRGDEDNCQGHVSAASTAHSIVCTTEPSAPQ